MSVAARVIIAALGLFIVAFAAQVLAANRAAPAVFGEKFCWLSHGSDVTKLKEMTLTQQGWFVPNPFRQLNRRVIGIGINDPEVPSPHFAIIALSGDDIRVAGWSYRKMAFWQEDQEVLRRFVSGETIKRCATILDETNG